jgi:hypothetical protein
MATSKPQEKVVCTSDFDVAMLNLVPRVHISVSINVPFVWISKQGISKKAGDQ